MSNQPTSNKAVASDLTRGAMSHPRDALIFLFATVLACVCGAYLSAKKGDAARRIDAQNRARVAEMEAHATAMAQDAERCDYVLVQCQSNYVRVIRGLEALELKCGGAK